MMYLPLDNTAFCLNCANEWSIVLDPKEPILVCPRCRWQLGIPRDFVLSGWWTTQERDINQSDKETDEREPPS